MIFNLNFSTMFASVSSYINNQKFNEIPGKILNVINERLPLSRNTKLIAMGSLALVGVIFAAVSTYKKRVSAQQLQREDLVSPRKQPQPSSSVSTPPPPPLLPPEPLSSEATTANAEQQPPPQQPASDGSGSASSSAKTTEEEEVPLLELLPFNAANNEASNSGAGVADKEPMAETAASVADLVHPQPRDDQPSEKAQRRRRKLSRSPHGLRAPPLDDGASNSRSQNGFAELGIASRDLRGQVTPPSRSPSPPSTSSTASTPPSPTTPTTPVRSPLFASLGMGNETMAGLSTVNQHILHNALHTAKLRAPEHAVKARKALATMSVAEPELDNAIETIKEFLLERSRPALNFSGWNENKIQRLMALPGPEKMWYAPQKVHDKDLVNKRNEAERRMHGFADTPYKDAEAAQHRPVYFAWNCGNAVVGGAPHYGWSYFVAKPGLLRQCTISAGDSFNSSFAAGGYKVTMAGYLDQLIGDLEPDILKSIYEMATGKKPVCELPNNKYIELQAMGVSWRNIEKMVLDRSDVPPGSQIERDWEAFAQAKGITVEFYDKAMWEGVAKSKKGIAEANRRCGPLPKAADAQRREETLRSLLENANKPGGLLSNPRQLMDYSTDKRLEILRRLARFPENFTLEPLSRAQADLQSFLIAAYNRAYRSGGLFRSAPQETHKVTTAVADLDRFFATFIEQDTLAHDNFVPWTRLNAIHHELQDLTQQICARDLNKFYNDKAYSAGTGQKASKSESKGEYRIVDSYNPAVNLPSEKRNALRIALARTQALMSEAKALKDTLTPFLPAEQIAPALFEDFVVSAAQRMSIELNILVNGFNN